MDTWPSLYGGCRSVCPYLRHDGEPGPEVVQSHAARVHAVDQDLGGTKTIHTHTKGGSVGRSASGRIRGCGGGRCGLLVVVVVIE